LIQLLFSAVQYAVYLAKAKTKYYIHSPFVYQFYLNVLENRIPTQHQTIVRSYRGRFKESTESITITDLGVGKNRSVELSKLEKKVAVTDKYGKVLYQLIANYKPKHILELGTSLGIGTLYIALANNETTVTTVEGSESILKIAREHHFQFGLHNIQHKLGNFDNLLPDLLKNEQFDMIYFDGNHTYEATIRYFNECLANTSTNSIFVFDDIYWSPGMCKAWKEICEHPRVKLTIDIYRMGIVFFRAESYNKESFILLY